ncbi:MAG: class I SAM-dependent methyltransferase [Planctomycetota bacterium]
MTDLTAPSIETHRATEAPDADQWAARFEALYAEAGGEHARIPWAHATPSPTLVRWLDREARNHVRCGGRACAVGCGLGDDAAELCRRGFDVTAFDASPAAIEHASARYAAEHPDIVWRVADLFELPSDLVGRFDLVAEVHTIQSLPPRYRAELAAGIAHLLHRHGVVVAVARGREESIPLDEVVGPPFAMTACELDEAFAQAGLTPVVPTIATPDTNTPPVLRLLGVYARPDR